MSLLFLTIVFPLLGFLALAFSQGRWSENKAAFIGVGSVGLAAAMTIIVLLSFYKADVDPTTPLVFTQSLWTWMSAADFNIAATLLLDGLSLTMIVVVIGVGFLIHLFASWYMRGEEGYSRFFAYTNLFIAKIGRAHV